MPLPDDYLIYPSRKPGPDHSRYTASPYRDRPALALSNGVKLGLWVTVLVEFFPLNPSGKPFKAPGAMQTPYPDLRHFTTRDYGNRVGIYRMLRLFERLGVTGTFAVQGAVAKRYPSLIKDIVGDGHEICSNGWDSDALHYSGLDPEIERRYIADALGAIESVTGVRPKGWISPARAEGFETPDLLAEAGIEWCGDWAHDDLPTELKTTSKTLTALPLSNELDDWQILVEYKRPEEEFVLQVGDAATLLRSEADRFGPQILSLVTRPYVMGQPYRIASLEKTLTAALALPDCAAISAADQVKAFASRP
jgi:peptidoglycan/xylan/chitin deacetylase (PgdA/CDA1 family)